MLYRTYKGGIRLTTQQIRFFLEAAECLNFTEAAKRLFVAQSTLSKQIALLEDELGLKLFYRSNRTVGPTPAGSLFRGEMEKVEHRLTEAIDRARHVNRGLDGTLSVGILGIIDPSLFVSPLLKLFQELNGEGHTIVMITHDLSVAQNARRVVRIVDGQLHNE